MQNVVCLNWICLSKSTRVRAIKHCDLQVTLAPLIIIHEAIIFQEFSFAFMVYFKLLALTLAYNRI